MSQIQAIFLKAFLLLFCILPGVGASAAEFLAPEQAFVFSAQLSNSHSNHPSVRVTFKIAPSYYMYRDDFAFTVVSPDGRVTQNGAVKMPLAKVKFDENFNKDVAYYRDTLNLDIPLRVAGEGDASFKVVIASRGCADVGLCYPPRKNQMVFQIAPLTSDASTAVVSGANGKNTSAELGANSPVSPNASSNSTTSQNQNNVPISEKIDDPHSTSAPIEIEPVNSTAPLSEPNAVAAKSAPSTKTLDNSQFASGLFEGKNILSTLGFVFMLGVLLSLTPCMYPMFPILTVILAGQKGKSSHVRGFGLAFAYVSGMALVYAAIGIVAARTGVALQVYLQNPWVLLGFALLLVILALSMFDVFRIQIPERWQLWLQTKTQGKHGYWGVLLMGAGSALIASPCITAPLVGLISYIVQTGQVALGGLALLVLAYGMGLPLLLLGAGLGRWLPKAGPWMVRIKMLIGVLMIGVAVWVAQPIWSPYWQSLLGQDNIEQTEQFASVSSMEDIQKQVAQSDEPVLIDLYATWCRSCIEMERETFPDTQVRERMEKMRLLRVDMTRNTEQDAEILKNFGLYGPPGIIVLEPKTGRELGRVVGFESPEVFTRSLDQILAQQSK